MSYQRKKLGLGKGYAGLGANTYASLLNLSRPGSASFYPGEAWQVTVSGAPNAPVWRTSGRPGATSQQQMGTTDATGMFTSSGVLDSAQMGQWMETWSVAGVSAPTLSYQVGAAPVVTSDTTTTTSSFDTSSITNLINMQVFGFPLWSVGLVGLFAYRMFGGRRR